MAFLETDVLKVTATPDANTTIFIDNSGTSSAYPTTGITFNKTNFEVKLVAINDTGKYDPVVKDFGPYYVKSLAPAWDEIPDLATTTTDSNNTIAYNGSLSFAYDGNYTYTVSGTSTAHVDGTVSNLTEPGTINLTAQKADFEVSDTVPLTYRMQLPKPGTTAEYNFATGEFTFTDKQEITGTHIEYIKSTDVPAEGAAGWTDKATGLISDFAATDTLYVRLANDSTGWVASEALLVTIYENGTGGITPPAEDAKAAMIITGSNQDSADVPDENIIFWNLVPTTAGGTVVFDFNLIGDTNDQIAITCNTTGDSLTTVTANKEYTFTMDDGLKHSFTVQVTNTAGGIDTKAFIVQKNYFTPEFTLKFTAGLE